MPDDMSGFNRLSKFQEGDYYYNEEGFLVFTEQYHLRRGYCCKNGCKHCPYGNSPSDQKKKKKQ